MVVLHNAAVRADRDIDAGLFIVLVAGLGHLDDSGCLAAADTLLLTGDADRAAADADLDKVRSRFGQEEEALAVNHVACADLDGVTVFGADEVEGSLLPLAEALGGVDAQHVGAGLDKQRHALGVVARVDARTHLVGLVRVQHLVGVRLMGIVVLAEHQIHQVVLVVHHRQRVQLVVPDDVVGNLQAGIHGRHDHVLARRHEAGHLLVHGHTRQTVVAVRHHAHQLAVRRAVLGHGHGGVAVLVLEGHHVGKRHLG